MEVRQIYAGIINSKNYKKFESGKSRIEFKLEQTGISFKDNNGNNFSPRINLIAWNEIADQINNIEKGIYIKLETQTTYKKQDPTKTQKMYLNSGTWKATNLYENEIVVKEIIIDNITTSYEKVNTDEFETISVDDLLNMANSISKNIDNDLLDDDSVLWD